MQLQGQQKMDSLPLLGFKAPISDGFLEVILRHVLHVLLIFRKWLILLQVLLLRNLLVLSRFLTLVFVQIQYQLQTAGLGEATEVVLSGGSAGGTSVFLGLDFVRSLIPSAVRLVGAPDAGFFIDAPTFANASAHAFRDSFISADAAMWNSTGSGSLNAHCLAAFAAEPWRCFSPRTRRPTLPRPGTP